MLAEGDVWSNVNVVVQGFVQEVLKPGWQPTRPFRQNVGTAGRLA